QDVKRLAVLLRVVGPIGFYRVPELLEAFLVGVAVLYDEGGDALGMLESEAPADGRPIVHDVHRIALHAERIEQAVNKLSEGVGVEGNRGGVGQVALPVAGVVGGNQVIAVGELGDKIAKHGRRGGEAVQQ